jgi:uncharacterized Zn finger protein (UPF0148 family)
MTCPGCPNTPKYEHNGTLYCYPHYLAMRQWVC